MGMLLLKWVILPIILTNIIIRVYIKTARTFSLVETNYKGKQIPVSIGITIPITLLFVPLLYTPFDPEELWNGIFISILFISFILGIVGFIDDIWGDKKIKGFKGHLGKLIKDKQVSTGLLKILVTLLAGISINVLYRENIIEIILGVITFALWTNLLNLFDLRPTRSIKVFWIFAIIFFLMFLNQIPTNLLLVLLVVSIMLFEFDRKEEGMLGDAGANVLGGILGAQLAIFSTVEEMIFFLLLALMITLYSEKYSISQWIDIHPWVKQVDNWGRKT